jgi:hypothetical protein
MRNECKDLVAITVHRTAPERNLGQSGKLVPTELQLSKPVEHLEARKKHKQPNEGGR